MYSSVRCAFSANFALSYLRSTICEQNPSDYRPLVGAGHSDGRISHTSPCAATAKPASALVGGYGSMAAFFIAVGVGAPCLFTQIR